MKKKILLLIYALIVVFTNTSSLLACDLCSIYSVVDSYQPSSGSFRVGLSEQFSSYGKQQLDSKHVDNTEHQHMESSITQVLASYDLNNQVSLQLNLPYINRSYKRFVDGDNQEGTESGIGDLTLLAKYTPYEYREEDKIFYFRLFGGFKFATGNAHLLGEEADAGHTEQEDSTEEDEHTIVHSGPTRHAGEDHGSEDSAVLSSIHGHDLALGSGSYDFPIGLHIYAEDGRTFASSNLQYTFRTRGAYGYEYADDLLWDLGPGYYLVLCPDYSLAFKTNLSGEYKRKDNVKGEIEDSTGLTTLFLGPEIILTAGNWNGNLAWDAPLDINNTGLQSVSDYRLRMAVTYRFE